IDKVIAAPLHDGGADVIVASEIRNRGLVLTRLSASGVVRYQTVVSGHDKLIDVLTHQTPDDTFGTVCAFRSPVATGSTLALLDDRGAVCAKIQLDDSQPTVLLGDLDGDGTSEIVTNWGGTITVFDGDGAQRFGRQLGSRLTALVVVDLDGDGLAEIVMGTR